MRLHVHMHLYVRLDLSSLCNQRTRSGYRARFVGYERLEDMNDCRFLHYWKFSISPGRCMCRNGGYERFVHNLSFVPVKSFIASNRSYPAKMPKRIPPSSVRTRYMPTLTQQSPRGRSRHALGARLAPIPHSTRTHLGHSPRARPTLTPCTANTYPVHAQHAAAAATAKPGNKKGRTGDPPPVRP